MKRTISELTARPAGAAEEIAMFIIGERINGMFRSVARAIAERDEAAIADLARRQVEAGANALDVNTGPTEGDPVEVMRWLVETIQSVVDVPLAIDSAKIPVIEAGLRAARRPAIINSTTGRPGEARHAAAAGGRSTTPA